MHAPQRCKCLPPAVERFGTLDNSEETIAILGDRWWSQTAKQEGDKTSKQFLCQMWGESNERPKMLVSLSGARTELLLQRDAWSIAK